MSRKKLAQLSKLIQIDFRSGVPIYVQIMDQVKQQVLSGGLVPGDQLPTVRALALELRVNFNTVARAYRLLDEAGIISTQQGRGTYILDIPPPERTDKLRRQALEALTLQYLQEALRLDVSSENIMETIKKQIEIWNETGHLPDHE